MDGRLLAFSVLPGMVTGGFAGALFRGSDPARFLAAGLLSGLYGLMCGWGLTLRRRGLMPRFRLAETLLHALTLAAMAGECVHMAALLLPVPCAGAVGACLAAAAVLTPVGRTPLCCAALCAMLLALGLSPPVAVGAAVQGARQPWALTALAAGGLAALSVSAMDEDSARDAAPLGYGLLRGGLMAAVAALSLWALRGAGEGALPSACIARRAAEAWGRGGHIAVAGLALICAWACCRDAALVLRARARRAPRTWTLCALSLGIFRETRPFAALFLAAWTLCALDALCAPIRLVKFHGHH